MPLTESLFDEFDHRGQWWLPTDSDKKISGNLKFNEDGCALELQGALSDPDALSSPIIILGIIDGSIPCTLYKSFRYKSQFGLTGTYLSAYAAQYILIGEHFQQPAEMKFKSASVNYTHFEEWIGRRVFKDEPIFDGENLAGMRATFLSNKESTELIAAVGAEFAVFHGFSNRGDSYRKLEWTHVAYLELIPDESKSLDWYLDIAFKCQNLLALFVGEPVQPKYFNLWFKNLQTDRKKQVRLYFEQRRTATRDRVRPRELIASFDRIKLNINEVLEKFFSQYDKLAPVYHLLLGTLYNPALYVDTQFLNLMQALETYHRKMCDGKYLPTNAYEEIREALAAAYKEVFSASMKSTASHRNELDDLCNLMTARLSFGNQVSLQTRMTELFSLLPEESTRAIISLAPGRTKGISEDVAGFIKTATKTRDYLTHYDEKSKRKAVAGTELYNVTLRLRALLTILLLRELELDQEVWESGVLNNEKFHQGYMTDIEYEDS